MVGYDRIFAGCYGFEKKYEEYSLSHVLRPRRYRVATDAQCAPLQLRVVVINIVAFELFDCEEFHSEYRPLEVTRHTPLTDKQVMHYFELPKLPEVISADDELKLWLALFKADTEEELKQIEALGVEVMQQAIRAYRSITVTPEFREAERLRSIARHDEAQALFQAEQIGEEREREKWQGEREKWQGAVSEKDAENARLREQLAALQSRLGEGK
jgi:predicted transposase/invertase (TIGR01784 family)